MARQCGICKKAPREGEEMRPVRLRTEAELEAFMVTEAGLYSSCLECVEKKRQMVVDDPDSEYDSLEAVPNKGLL
jgi:hypothetical protein